MVVPAEMPVTIPVEPMVPIVVGLQLHVPPGVASASGLVLPVHALAVPVIGAGAAFTVTVVVTTEVQPEELVTE